MKEFRMRAFFGILGLAGAGFMISSVSSVGGCSSSNGGSTGTAGSSSTGTAGTGQGTAGTTGNGGNNSGGSGGGGGASQPPMGCAVSDLAPGDTGGAYTITDFTAVDGGASIPIGGTFTYASPSTAVAPTAAVTNGGWHITLNAPGMTDPQYIGVGIYFNGNASGTDCVDATAHTGVKFDISGSIAGTGCTAQYSTNDSAHSAVSATDPKAGGPAGSYAPQKALTVTSTVATVMMPFAGADAPQGGSPATAIDKSKLTGVQWQFTVAGGTANACMVDIVIDNVAFY
jgi:hypothetical protein